MSVAQPQEGRTSTRGHDGRESSGEAPGRRTERLEFFTKWPPALHRGARCRVECRGAPRPTAAGARLRPGSIRERPGVAAAPRNSSPIGESLQVRQQPAGGVPGSASPAPQARRVKRLRLARRRQAPCTGFSPALGARAAPRVQRPRTPASGQAAYGRPLVKREEAGERRYWSGEVTRTSNALDLDTSVFTWDSPKRIAASLKRSAETSRRRKTSPFRSAMSMLTFYLNRGGRNLSAERRAVLERAKDELRQAFGRPAAQPAAGAARGSRAGGGSAAARRRRRERRPKPGARQGAPRPGGRGTQRSPGGA